MAEKMHAVVYQWDPELDNDQSRLKGGFKRADNGGEGAEEGIINLGDVEEYTDAVKADLAKKLSELKVSPTLRLRVRVRNAHETDMLAKDLAVYEGSITEIGANISEEKSE